MTFTGCVGGIFVSFMNDRIAGRMKTCIVILYTLASIGFILFGLEVLGIWGAMPDEADRKWWLRLTVVVGGVFLNSPLPLFYEMAVEETYPRISVGAP